MLTTGKVWECDICGYRWLYVDGKTPLRCANRECRKREWNGKSKHPPGEQPRVLNSYERLPEADQIRSRQPGAVPNVRRIPSLEERLSALPSVRGELDGRRRPEQASGIGRVQEDD